MVQIDTEPFAPVAAKISCKTLPPSRPRVTGHPMHCTSWQTESPTRCCTYHRCSVIQYDFCVGTSGSPTDEVSKGFG